MSTPATRPTTTSPLTTSARSGEEWSDDDTGPTDLALTGVHVIQIRWTPIVDQLHTWSPGEVNSYTPMSQSPIYRVTHGDIHITHCGADLTNTAPIHLVITCTDSWCREDHLPSQLPPSVSLVTMIECWLECDGSRTTWAVEGGQLRLLASETWREDEQDGYPGRWGRDRLKHQTEIQARLPPVPAVRWWPELRVDPEAPPARIWYPTDLSDPGDEAACPLSRGWREWDGWDDYQEPTEEQRVQYLEGGSPDLERRPPIIDHVTEVTHATLGDVVRKLGEPADLEQPLSPIVHLDTSDHRLIRAPWGDLAGQMEHLIAHWDVRDVEDIDHPRGWRPQGVEIPLVTMITRHRATGCWFRITYYQNQVVGRARGSDLSLEGGRTTAHYESIDLPDLPVLEYLHYYPELQHLRARCVYSEDCHLGGLYRYQKAGMWVALPPPKR